MPPKRANKVNSAYVEQLESYVTLLTNELKQFAMKKQRWDKIVALLKEQDYHIKKVDQLEHQVNSLWGKSTNTKPPKNDEQEY